MDRESNNNSSNNKKLANIVLGMWPNKNRFFFLRWVKAFVRFYGTTLQFYPFSIFAHTLHRCQCKRSINYLRYAKNADKHIISFHAFHIPNEIHSFELKLERCYSWQTKYSIMLLYKTLQKG
jgi:hypothetical protein